MSDLAEIARSLDAARARLAAVASGGLGALDAWRSARAEVLGLERRLAAARGEEHAVPLEGVPPWDAGAPEPRLLLGGGRAFVLSHAREEGSVGVVELRGVRASRTGPLDEASAARHPLSGRGFEPMTAQLVEGSRWAAELGGRHFAFWFHDEGIEVLADSLSASLVEGDMAEVTTGLARRLATP